jgi:transposase
MSLKYSPSFKEQAVKKALSRGEGVTLAAVATKVGIDRSTLNTWIEKAKTNLQQTYDDMTKNHEKKPQDWSMEERFEMLVSCANLDDEAVNQRCRERGLYAHHLAQWRHDFLSLAAKNISKDDALELKKVKQDLSETKKELHRKTKALAEAAALLVLQKKVNAHWSNDEDDSL